MTEWGVVGVLIALIGLATAVVKPMLTLNTSIVTLTERLTNLGEDLKKLADENSGSHKRLWDKNAEQDARINRHEIELDRLTNKKGA